MNIVEEQVITEAYTSAIYRLYFGSLRVGFLDIETTGLSAERSRFILGGIQSDGSIRQYFAEDPGREEETLEAFLADAAGHDVLVTYNGKHFDIPFLETRCERCAVARPEMPYDLDIYRVIDKYSPLRKILPNLKQKSVEDFLGLWQRTDEISGAEVVQLYEEYVLYGDQAVRDKILLHNRDDVFQLSKLLPILGKADVHKAMFHMGFPVKLHLPAAETPGGAEAQTIPAKGQKPQESLQKQLGGHRQPGSSAADHRRLLYVEKTEIGRNFLRVSGRQHGPGVNYLSFGDPDREYGLAFDKDRRRFEAVMPLYRRGNDSWLDLEKLSANRADHGLWLEPLKKHPAYVNGYLVLENDGAQDCLAANYFVKLFLEGIAKEVYR